MSFATPSLRVVAYNATARKTKKAAPIPQQKWDEHKNQIVRRFHIGHTRDQILSYLKSKGFRPTPRQLYFKMHDDWSLRRYNGLRSVSSGVPAMEGVVSTNTDDDVYFREPLIFVWEYHVNRKGPWFKKIAPCFKDDCLPSYLIYLPIHFPTDAIRQAIVPKQRPTFGKLATYDQCAFFGQPISSREMTDMINSYLQRRLSQSSGIDDIDLALIGTLVQILAMLTHVDSWSGAWNSTYQSVVEEREIHCRAIGTVLTMMSAKVPDSELLRKMIEMYRKQRLEFDLFTKPYTISLQHRPPTSGAELMMPEHGPRNQSYIFFGEPCRRPHQYGIVEPVAEMRRVLVDEPDSRSTGYGPPQSRTTIRLLLHYSQCTPQQVADDGYRPPCCGVW